VVAHTPEATEALEARHQILLDIPVIKEETFHIDAACERSDLHSTEGIFLVFNPLINMGVGKCYLHAN